MDESSSPRRPRSFLCLRVASRRVRAFVFTSHGGPEVMRLAQIPEPVPAHGEVVLSVKAAALNRLDLFVRQGWPGLKLAMPHVPASDIAGVTSEGERVVVYPDLSCGKCAACLRGDNVICAEHRLIGEHTPGGLAEQVAIPRGNAVPLPAHVSFETAAAASLTFVTAWRMLKTRAELAPGESVLVVGSGGGVNTAAIQIAKLLGARVTVLAGGPEKAKRALAIGADDVIDYRATPEWARETHKRTAGAGFDVVVDNVGRSTWEKSLKAVARGGRVVTVGGTTGYDPSAGLNYVFWKQISVLGSTMGTRAEYDEVMGHVFEGRLKPVIDRVVPLERAGEAFEALEKGENFGKIVVKP